MEIEKERLREIRVAYPEMFEICDDYGTPCCQAATKKGEQCRRPALTTKTYYQRVRCCYLCWQHALMYGVYGILATGKAVYESGLSWDEYCFLNPEKCEDYFDDSKDTSGAGKLYEKMFGDK